MVSSWWAVAGAVVPAFLIRNVLSANRAKEEEKRRGRDNSLTSEPFVCERVCTSKRMLNKLGPFSKDPTPNTCVTVCGVSEVDACTEACRMSVCVNQHHVPNWNDVCMRRCSDECLKGR